MKFFFPELGFCFGGTVLTPETETAIAAVVTTNPRRITHGNSTKHWRPELTTISEDGGVLNVCQQSNQSVSVVGSQKKPLNKAKSAGKTRSRSYVSSYRNFSHAMAIPAFSPTPFVF